MNRSNGKPSIGPDRDSAHRVGVGHIELEPGGDIEAFQQLGVARGRNHFVTPPGALDDGRTPDGARRAGDENSHRGTLPPRAFAQLGVNRTGSARGPRKA